jgi:hypothetical protein
LGTDLDQHLGLSPSQWEEFQAGLTKPQRELFLLKQQKYSDPQIAKILGCTQNQVEKQWFKILEQSWEIRNHEISKNNVSESAQPSTLLLEQLLLMKYSDVAD